MCGSTCTDVKYNNSACGDCNNACPSTAPRCDNGTCKCDSPPCGGGTATGGAPGQGGTTSTGGTTATSTTPPATGGSTSNGTATQPPLNGGTDGWASRYWDCCKPSCGWTGNTGGKTPIASCGQNNQKLSGYDDRNACENGGTAYECWDLAPWSVSDTLAYGFVAHNQVPCGTCYQLDFTGATHNGNAASTGPLKGKTMIVQVINIGGIGAEQFDILIPGGGVGDFDACSKQWGTSDLGARYGGFLGGCSGDKSCVQTKCASIFSDKPALKAGCDWFTGWFNAADNPSLKYATVPCPSAITAKSGMSG